MKKDLTRIQDDIEVLTSQLGTGPAGPWAALERVDDLLKTYDDSSFQACRSGLRLISPARHDLKKIELTLIDAARRRGITYREIALLLNLGEDKRIGWQRAHRLAQQLRP